MWNGKRLRIPAWPQNAELYPGSSILNSSTTKGTKGNEEKHSLYVLCHGSNQETALGSGVCGNLTDIFRSIVCRAPCTPEFQLGLRVSRSKSTLQHLDGFCSPCQEH